MKSFVDSVSRLVLLPALVVAVAVWAKGYVEAGDGFGAGVLGALAVLLQYVTCGREEARRLPGVRHAPRIALVGLLLVQAVAFVPLLWGAAPVTHYPRPGQPVWALGSLELHTAVLLDAGILLLVMGFIVTVIDGLVALRPGARRLPVDPPHKGNGQE